MTIDHPLRLAVGSHQAGSGMGCAMNLISWENGDTRITDMPACADPMLTRIVQKVNDTICTHRDGDLLCPPCSIAVLELAHRTVGTGGVVDVERRRVWVRIAADQARQVLHLAKNQEATETAIVAAERWADTPSGENTEAALVAAAATTVSAAYADGADGGVAASATRAAASAAASAAAYAGAASADADAAYAATVAAAYADAAAAAAYAATRAAAYAATRAAAYADAAHDARLRLAHRAINLFEQLTNHTPQPTPAAHTIAAYTAMTNPRPA